MPRSSVLDKVKQGQDEFNEGRKKKRDEWVSGVNVMLLRYESPQKQRNGLSGFLPTAKRAGAGGQYIRK